MHFAPRPLQATKISWNQTQTGIRTSLNQTGASFWFEFVAGIEFRGPRLLQLSKVLPDGLPPPESPLAHGPKTRTTPDTQAPGKILESDLR